MFMYVVEIFLYVVWMSKFLQFTNVACQDFISKKSPLQEYETQYEHHLDMEDEFCFEANPKGRSGNYSTQEDTLLCQAWKKIGPDPVVGVEQTMTSYWDHIYAYFPERNTSGIHRTQASRYHR